MLMLGKKKTSLMFSNDCEMLTICSLPCCAYSIPETMEKVGKCVLSTSLRSQDTLCSTAVWPWSNQQPFVCPWSNEPQLDKECVHILTLIESKTTSGACLNVGSAFTCPKHGKYLNASQLIALFNNITCAHFQLT